jgi:acyl carrier protein
MNDAGLKVVVTNILKGIAPEFDYDQLADNANLRKTLDIDSFDALRFFIGIKEELGVDIPESDYGNLTTLAEIVRYLSEQGDVRE